MKRTSILDEEHEGRDQLELPEGGVKKVVMGGWDAVDWSDLALNKVQCRTANTRMTINLPSRGISLLAFQYMLSCIGLFS